MVTTHKDTTEDGYTLVELLITLVIEALILGALGTAFILMLNGTKTVNQSLSRSGDARIAANYVIADARNSSGPQVSLGTASCTDASPPVSGTANPIVQFASTRTSSVGTNTTYVVDYILVNNSLLRRVCTNGSTVSSSDRVVASNVGSVTAACSPTANCTGNPTSITVTVNEVADNNGNVYSYTLKGAFRQLDGTGAPAAPVPAGPAQSVILLGSGGKCSGTTDSINLAGGAQVKVYGKTYINTANNTSCNALDISNGAAFNSGSTSILSGGTCVGSPCPTMTTYSPAIADPYASLAVPSTSGMTTYASAACSGTLQPGVYTNGISATTGACTLASGIYILNGPLTASNGASLTSASGGVFIYMTNGAFTIGGGVPVTLSAMTTGTYAGMVFWQAAADTTTISWANGGAIVLNGALYAPKARLDIQGGAVAPIISSLVVQAISAANGISITIGSPLSINSPATLPAWSVGTAYPATSFGASGGGGAYTWSATGMPGGLSISSTSGILSGTPTTAGTFSVVVTLNDAAGDVADTASFSVTINPAPAITSASPLAGGDVTVAYSKTLTKTPGTGTTVWTSATGLPAGLTFNPSTGVISGTPTTAGTSNVVVTITDSVGATDIENFALTISAMPTISTASPLAGGEKTAPYSTAVAGSGGTSPYTWSSSTLPAGLSIGSSTGVISGTPTATGTTAASILLTDAAGGTVTKSLSITVAAQPVISSVALTNKASGGTAGKMEVGDKITVVYGSAMNPTSFCSSWTTGDQSLTGANLQVNVTDGGSGNDSLNITNTSGTGCTTFNFGTINLGNAGYVTASSVFGGSTTNTSIAWTASSKTLVITLGALKSGTVGTVAGTTSPIYTASTSITDTVGGLLGNSPFTATPAAVRF